MRRDLRRCQSVTRWKAAAARGGPSPRRTAARRSRDPTGIPSTKPHGTLATGTPARRPRRVERDQRQPVRHALAVQLDRLLADARRDNRHGGLHEQVEAPERRVQLVQEPAPGTEPGHVRGRGQEQPREQACANVRSVVVEAGPQPLEMGLRRLGKQDRLHDRPGLLEQRDLDRLETSLRASAARRPPRGRSRRPRGRRARRAPRRRRSGALADRPPGPAGTRARAPRAASCSPRRSARSGRPCRTSRRRERRPRSRRDRVDGRSPVTPQKQAGIRIEPAVSVPSVPAARSAAAAAPLPPLEPPQTRSSAHGFRAGPKCGLVVSAPKANSCVLSFPRTIAAGCAQASDRLGVAAWRRCRGGSSTPPSSGLRRRRSRP